MHVVILGAGRGLQTAIRAVRPLAKRVTAVVPTSNDTGVDALIRRLGPFPGAGTALQVIVHNGHDAAQLRVMQQVFAPLGTPFDGVPFVVFDTVAHAAANGGMPDALQRLRGVVHCDIDVLMVSDQVHDAWVAGESPARSSVYFATAHTAAVQGLTLEPPVTAHPAVLHALKTADAVVIAPGALYTEVLPVLLPAGIGETLRSTKARVVCVAGLTTVAGQTDAFRAVDYVARIARSLGRGAVDVALINTETYSSAEQAVLRQHGTAALRYEPGDHDILEALGVAYLGRALRTVAPTGESRDAVALSTHDETELRMSCMMAFKR
ncbi:MAG: hypothetical protein RLZZ297_1717 [Chloroflexota bacterium]|jgi:uncharacterized cofD-like protein